MILMNKIIIVIMLKILLIITWVVTQIMVTVIVVTIVTIVTIITIVVTTIAIITIITIITIENTGSGNESTTGNSGNTNNNQQEDTYSITFTPIKTEMGVLQYSVQITKNGKTFNEYKGVTYNSQQFRFAENNKIIPANDVNSSINTAKITLNDGKIITANVIYK